MKQLRAGRLMVAAVVVVVAALALGVSVAGAHRSDSGFDSVVSGLGNPRGIAFDEHGQLYVAESGDGGTLCRDAAGCVGLTSKITKVDVKAGTKSPFITGLLSVGDNTGTFSIGATGVAVNDGKVYALMGGNPNGAPPASVCNGAQDCLDAIAAAQNLGGVLRADRKRATSTGSRTSAPSTTSGRPTTTRRSLWMAGRAAYEQSPRIAAAPATPTSTPATRTRTRWPRARAGTTWSTAARTRSPGCRAMVTQACWPRSPTRPLRRVKIPMTPCRRA